MWHSYWCLPEPHKQVLPLRNVLSLLDKVWKLNCFSIRIGESLNYTVHPNIYLGNTQPTWNPIPLCAFSKTSQHIFQLYLTCIWTTSLISYFLTHFFFFPNDCSSGNNRLIWLLRNTEKPSVNVKPVYSSCGKLHPDWGLWKIWTVNQICSCFSLLPDTLVSISECQANNGITIQSQETICPQT